MASVKKNMARIKKKYNDKKAERQKRTSVIKTEKYGVEWQVDDMSNNCTACNKKFSFLIRKHHCRNCGNIFCKNCCANRLPVPGSNKALKTAIKRKSSLDKK